MNDNLIERTEKLLNGITPGEWRASLHNGITYDDGSSSFQCGIYPAQVKGLAPVLLTNNIDRRNAAFIAAAPELARELLAEVKRLRDVMDELTDVLYVPTDEIVDAVRRRAKEYAAARLAESERDAALAKLDAVRAWTQNGEAYNRGGQRKELFRILDGEGASDG